MGQSGNIPVKSNIQKSKFDVAEGVGGRGRSFYTNFVYWLNRIFEISNHILENAFSQYKVSKVMLKRLINCL